MNLLNTVTIQLPNADNAFGHELLDLLAPFGKRKESELTFTKSDSSFLPNIRFSLIDVEVPTATFDLGDEIVRIETTDQTDEQRDNPAMYWPITIGELIERMEVLQTTTLDHVGFNLPWFDGIHPEVLKLREKLAPTSAYYRFPTGENWDFVIPASEDEIVNNTIDLSRERRPKLEIVSFEKSSTPLIQIDLSVRQRFKVLETLFPEGLVDKSLKNIWVYVTNPYGIDLCFVIGETVVKDWSEFFEGHRLGT